MRVLEKIKNFLYGGHRNLKLAILLFFASLTMINIFFSFFACLWIFITMLLNREIEYDFEVYIVSFRMIDVFSHYLVGAILLAHIIRDVIKKEIKPKKSFLISLIALLLYMRFVPLVVRGAGLSIKFFLIAIVLFYAYHVREKVDFVDVAKKYVYIIVVLSIVSGILYLCGISLGYQYIEFKVKRFNGFSSNPNVYFEFLGLALSVLYFLKLREKMKDVEFFVLYAFLVLFSLLSMSRMFALLYVLTTALFLIFYIRKNKKNSLKFLAIFSVITIVCFVVLYKHTEAMFLRFLYPKEAGAEKIELTESEIQMVLNGEMYYDPGRVGLWKLYIRQIFASPLKFLFGYGLGGAIIGQAAHAHCSAIEFMYRFGFVGYILLGLFVSSIINFKKLKSWKAYLPTIILIVGMYTILLLNCNSFGMLPYILLIFAFPWLTKEAKQQNEESNDNKAEMEHIETKQTARAKHTKPVEIAK